MHVSGQTPRAGDVCTDLIQLNDGVGDAFVIVVVHRGAPRVVFACGIPNKGYDAVKTDLITHRIGMHTLGVIAGGTLFGVIAQTLSEKIAQKCENWDPRTLKN